MIEPRINGRIEADEVSIGHGVVMEAGAVISGRTGSARRVVLGDFCYIGEGCKILVPEFSLGDYSKLNANAFVHGEEPIQIGRNCWFGGNVVLDSMGGLDIDDNVGVGAHSQLWTHIQFGDLVEGSRFHSRKYMHVGKDAWFVGHCLVSPVSVGERSMAMLGSVVTHDMLPNHVYAGVPAKDMTERIGPQFQKRKAVEKAEILKTLIVAFEAKMPEYAGVLQVVTRSEDRQDGVTWFDVSTRTYNKLLLEAEIAFLRAHVPLVKFVADGEPPFVTPRNVLA